MTLPLIFLSGVIVTFFLIKLFSKTRVESTEAVITYNKEPYVLAENGNNAMIHSMPRLKLKGILSDAAGNFSTIINKSILKEGQTILGAIIDKIHVDKVDLTFRNKKFSLYLR